MSDHVTPESSFFCAEEKVQILSGKCPCIMKVWVSFQKGTARDGSALSDGTKKPYCFKGTYTLPRCYYKICHPTFTYVYHILISDHFNSLGL